MNSRARVCHVTEAMGGGIITFLDSISRRQVEQGIEVEVLYVRRPETPEDQVLRERFHPGVTLEEVVPRIGRLGGLRALLARLRAVEVGAFDVVHLHSSYAGAIGRIFIARGVSVSYSPHGYGFLRRDLRAAVRLVLFGCEALLSTRGRTLVTSATELAIASRLLRARSARFLQSGVPRSSIPIPTEPVCADQLAVNDRPLVLMTGRMVYQKAPWRFAAVARALDSRAEFMWVGGGDPLKREEWLGSAPVTVLDWVTPHELQDVMARADVFLFPTLWEGMALSLIQAQSLGVPAVTSDVVGNRDTVIDEVTGFVCRSDEEIIASVRRLLDSPSLRLQMGANAREHALNHLTDDRIGIDSLEMYGLAEASLAQRCLLESDGAGRRRARQGG